MSKNKIKYYFLYKTTNLINGKYYYGMHSTYKIDDGYLGSGKMLRYSIRKYGKENFILDIIKFCNSREELVDAEIMLITEEVIFDNLCMNLKKGGMGGFTSEGVKNGRKKCDIILREKYGDDFRSIVAKNYHESLTESDKKGWIDKIKKSQIGMFRSHFINKKHTDESKVKIGEKNSILQKGEKNSQFGTCWITKEGVNKKIKKEVLDIYIKDGWIKGRSC